MQTQTRARFNQNKNEEKTQIDFVRSFKNRFPIKMANSGWIDCLLPRLLLPPLLMSGGAQAVIVIYAAYEFYDGIRARKSEKKRFIHSNQNNQEEKKKSNSSRSVNESVVFYTIYDFGTV